MSAFQIPPNNINKSRIEKSQTTELRETAEIAKLTRLMQRALTNQEFPILCASGMETTIPTRPRVLTDQELLNFTRQSLNTIPNAKTQLNSYLNSNSENVYTDNDQKFCIVTKTNQYAVVYSIQSRLKILSNEEIDSLRNKKIESQNSKKQEHLTNLQKAGLDIKETDPESLQTISEFLRYHFVSGQTPNPGIAIINKLLQKIDNGQVKQSLKATLQGWMDIDKIQKNL